MVFKNRKQRRNVDKEENDQDLALGPPTLRFGRAAKMAKKLKGTPTNASQWSIESTLEPVKEHRGRKYLRLVAN